MKQELRNLGRLFIVGFPGETPSSIFLNFIVEEEIGGVILFEENCRTGEQASENIKAIRSSVGGYTPFIAVDQEGGRVSRLRGAPAEIPAAALFGKERDTEHFREVYGRCAVYLERLGFNLNLAPVADLSLNAENSCLKDRCFGDDPEKVGEFVRASVETAHMAGLLCCLKHFPGLGASNMDPHHLTATAEYDKLTWEQRERIPFAAGLKAGADLVMTTHLQLPNLDADHIATGSSTIIKSILRRDLDFDGPVITDDLCMKGASSLGSIGDRTVAAFNAGHDLLLFGQDFDLSAEAYECFAGAVSRGEVNERRLKEAQARIAGLKFKLERSMTR